MSLSASMVLHHLVENSSAGCPFPELNVTHHEMFLIGPSKHVSKISLKLLPKKPSPGNLLNLNYFISSLIEVDDGDVSLSVAPVQTLDQYCRRVSFKNSS